MKIRNNNNNNNNKIKYEIYLNQIMYFSEGVFIGEVNSLMLKKRVNTLVEVVEDSQLILIPAESLNSFLYSNPGLQILFRDSLVIE